MSNSLTELNGFSNQPVSFTDFRPYTISFNPDTPANANIAISEDQAFLSPVGTNIVECIAQPNNITYNIDLSSVGNIATVTWPEPLPPTVSILNPGGNVYSVTGVFSAGTWDQVRSPVIQVKDRATAFSYTANIQYPDPANVANTAVKSWTVNASVTADEELSVPLNWLYVRNFAATIDGAPQIVDAYPGAELYTITVTPNNIAPVSLLSSSGTGGTSSFNTTTKVLTIVGNKAQVNSHLSNILFTPVPDQIQGFSLTYSLTNPISGLVTTRIQTVTSSNAAFNIGAATYVEDTGVDLDYTVVDQSATATSYTIEIKQFSPSINTYPGYFTLEGSNVGNTLTWTGTRTQVNAANVWYFPPVDYTANVTLRVTQTKIDNGQTVVMNANENWLLQNAGTNPEIANMIAREYYTNKATDIFATNTPVISDGPDLGQTYTITLSSSLGKFSTSATTVPDTYSFTGNITAVNEQFTLLKFFATPGAAPTTGTFTYTQSRNGVSQVNMSVALNGSVGFFTPVTYSFYNTTTWTPTFSETYYGTTQILTVGGGGGAGRPGDERAGAGGGGGMVREDTFAPGTLPSGTYNITVGSGGAQGTGTTGGTGGNTLVRLGNVTYAGSAGGSGGAGNVYPAVNKGGNSVKFVPPATNQITQGGAGRAAYLQANGTYYGPNGGGGASSTGNGGNAPLTAGGNGANGVLSTITGVNKYYGGGGAGSSNPPGGPAVWGTPGTGGGGAGYPYDGNGTPYTGGGGAPSASATGGRGGSGVVVIKIA